MMSGHGKSELSGERHEERLTVERGGQPSSRADYLWGLIISSGILLIAVVFPRGTVPSGGCPFKLTLNRPCPACGLTRGVQDVFSGDLGRALIECPLSMVISLLVIAVFIRSMVGLLTGRDVLSTGRFASRRILVGGSILLILLNWVYRLTNGYV